MEIHFGLGEGIGLQFGKSAIFLSKLRGLVQYKGGPRW